MMAWIKKATIVGLATMTLAAAAITTSVPANAQRVGGFHGGWHGGGWHGGGWHGGGWRGRGWGWGPAIAGGIALGALAAAPYYGYGYGYDYGCGQRVVGYDLYGQPIVRAVGDCW
jgi:hypothetical protein